MPNNLGGRSADIAVLGPKNTNTDLVAAKYEKSLKKKLQKKYLPSVEAVVKAVAKHQVRRGIIPLKNSIDGPVKETRLALKKYKVRVLRKLQMPIKYALVMLPAAQKKDIKTIASHEQALKQCGKYLGKYFSHSRIQKYPSTIAALEKIIKAGNRYTAAIIPLQAAQKYQLKILARNIQNSKKNRTTFLVIASKA